MGSYINVGIVYSGHNINNINDDLLFLTKYILRFGDKLLVNYSKDDSYENWVEELYIGDEIFKAFMILSKYNMSLGKMNCKIHNINCNILISIKSYNDLLKGILFEFPEKELLQDDYSNENLNNITNQIANTLVELWNDMEFSYAFCDSEADIEYQLCELQQSKKTIYSMLLLKNNCSQPTIHLSEWNIDGITKRI